MTLMLELNGDMPEKFPGHERRLYIWACRRKACRRKKGSVRAMRAVRVTNNGERHDQEMNTQPALAPTPSPKQNIGAALFGATSSIASSQADPFSSGTNSNPFSATSTPNNANPFSSAPGPLSSLAAKPAQKPNGNTTIDIASLPASFAQKVSLLQPSNEKAHKISSTPWPPSSSFPTPFPYYNLDADYEYLSPTSDPQNSNVLHASLLDTEPSNGASSSKESSDALYESSHDKAFQHFADTLAQNPDQVLRYDFGGTPLLYSRNDEVGRLLAPEHAEMSMKVPTMTTGRIPRCGSCGAGRLFEVQLTPHAITELEADEEGATLLGEGMEWGTVIVGVCEKDCGGAAGRTGYVEEWAGVQWEEVVDRRKR